MTLSDALIIKNLIDCVGGDIVLKSLKDEAREVVLQALIDGEEENDITLIDEEID